MVLACVVPALVVSTYLAWQNNRLERQLIYGRTELLARNIAAELDRELAAIESGLKVLATSNALRIGDLRRFHRLASDAVRAQIVYNYILTDSSGRQIINTLKPYGTPLPATGTPPQLAAVFAGAGTVLTDLFVGPVTGKPAIAMGVPVLDANQQVIYSLNIGLAPEKLSALLERKQLPEDWLVAVIDGTGTIIGRSREADRFVGQKAVAQLLEHLRSGQRTKFETHTKEGVPVITTTAPLSTYDWTVVVGAPKAQIEGERARNVMLIVAAGLGIVSLGGWLAFRITRRVIDSVQDLNAAAIALREGKPLPLPGVQIREAEAVSHAIVKASELMAEVHHRAYHDPLTDLANRDLFYELVQHHLAEAGRHATTLAILAIDLDHFKKVNDTAGHAAGDRLLRAVAARIAGSIRAADVAARMGGDEFSVMLVQTDEGGVVEIAERLMAQLAAPYPGITTAISASIGIAMAPSDGNTLDDLLEAADRALYAAKSAGRNTFRFATDPTVIPN